MIMDSKSFIYLPCYKVLMELYCIARVTALRFYDTRDELAVFGFLIVNLKT